MDYGKFQDDIQDLRSIPTNYYENIFKVYKDGEYYFYNILQCVQLPKDMNTDVFEVVEIPGSMPLSTLSFKLYKTINLWWLICLANKIDDPTQFIAPGTTIRAIKPHYVGEILADIQEQVRLL